ncbi:hypothetical protein B0H16DRAFT_1735557 [Mycena metata]|uniref:Uncharacterized protein n=1 Tax=Mycena metata TaxID=1033252 RepID=A0AAD7HRG9_9AGAR|nr:hypothetical protein B0H16DRAFT_1735557 [Mycena metata]
MTDADSSLSPGDTASAYYETIDSQLDTPLVDLRAPSSVTPIIENSALDNALSAPLATLRAPAANTDYIIFPRPASPTPTEPVDSDEETLDYIEGSEERYENILAGQTNQSTSENVHASLPAATSSATDVNAALPVTSSTRSMLGQTTRSFESRPRAAADNTSSQAGVAKAASKKKAAKKQPSRSASSLSASGAAPSDHELYDLGGLLAPTNKEPAAELKVRNEENTRRLIAWILAIQKSVDDERDARSQQDQEILRRFSDLQISCNATSSSSPIPNTMSQMEHEIAHLKQLMVDGRNSINRITECMNGLVDIPVEMEGLQQAMRTLQASNRVTITSGSSTTTSAPRVTTTAAHTSGLPHNVGNHFHAASAPTDMAARGQPAAATSHKRTRTPEPVHQEAADHGAKRLRGEDAEFAYDVYAFNFKAPQTSPKTAGPALLKALNLPTEPLINCIHPFGLPNTLISLRFDNAESARQFMDRLRTNPPADMDHLRVATSVAYGKMSERETGHAKAKSAPKTKKNTW